MSPDKMSRPDGAAADLDAQRFARDGYVILPGLLSGHACSALQAAVAASLNPLLGPAEYEADVGYPGAPVDRNADGGATPRRLLHALSRGAPYRELAQQPAIGARIRAFLGAETVLVSQSHHNCVMTKHPSHSSRTGWHHDIRYWSFDRPELISVWIALGSERPANGGLWLIPGSHRMVLDRGQFDAALFLREGLTANRQLIAAAVPVQLEAGDALFFHCNLFHSAGANSTDGVKLSLVFTYHAQDNHPIPGTRSANYPSLPVR